MEGILFLSAPTAFISGAASVPASSENVGKKRRPKTSADAVPKMNDLSNEMLAGVLMKRGEIRFEKRPRPVPRSSEVLVRVRTVGICGSDVHKYAGEGAGSADEIEPIVLGHEAAGVVIGVGSSVRDL